MAASRLWPVALVALVALLTAALLAGAAGAAKPVKGGGAASFTSFSLAATPPNPAGTSCPGDPLCYNNAAEPAIRADGAGNFYATSENNLGEGTLAWRSTDNGLHYSSLLSPDDLSAAGDSTGQELGTEPGGGDTDLAVATAKNALGNYNVYAASLSLANIDVSTSQDKGATWTLNPAVTPETGDDREWIAAYGAQKVCVSYHNGPQGIDVVCSTDAGTTFPQIATAFDAAHQFQTGENEIGNLAIDASSGTIYQTYSAITTAAETACAPQLGVIAGTCNYHGVYMAVSTDGGLTFTDYPVYINPDPAVGYGHQFVNVSVDRGGNVYSVYTDDHHVYYSFSKNQGQTWSGPYLVSDVSGTQIFPWSTAGDAGKLDVVYYQTPFYDGATIPDNYPASATWTVGFAQNLSALTPGSSWSRTTATDVVHTGGVCESGVTCTGNRDLYDDFGVAASPTTGLASIVYSDDQYESDATHVPNTGFGCTDASQSSTANCNHTDIATQTAGSGIFATATTGGGGGHGKGH